MIDWQPIEHFPDHKFNGQKFLVFTHEGEVSTATYATLNTGLVTHYAQISLPPVDWRPDDRDQVFYESYLVSRGDYSRGSSLWRVLKADEKGRIYGQEDEVLSAIGLIAAGSDEEYVVMAVARLLWKVRTQIPPSDASHEAMLDLSRASSSEERNEIINRFVAEHPDEVGR